VQLVSHLAPPAVAHWLLGQVLDIDVLHAPSPLQTEAVVTLPLTQVAAVQIVALSGNVQVFPLVPSHCPAHGPVPPQASRGPTGVPWTALHVPRDPVSLHDSHWPSHDVSQHNPSTQCPVEHSASILHAVGSEPCISIGASIVPASLPPEPLPPEPLPPEPPLPEP
jgi:hypothetical protein